MAKSAPVPARPAIQSNEQAGLEAQEYKDAQAEIERLTQAEKSSIDALKQQFALLRKPHEEVSEDRFERVRAWAEANRAGRKTIRFPNGREFRWRKASSAKLIIGGTIHAIVKSLMERPDWEKFVKVDLKKSNLAANSEVVEDTDGLSLHHGEYVSIG